MKRGRNSGHVENSEASMMFKKKRGEEPQKPEIFVPWDDKTQDRIAALDQFNVQITSVVRLDGFGRTANYGAAKLPSFEISGFLTNPRFLYVQITFETGTSEDFGGWFYHLYDKGDRTHGRDLPFLEVWINDTDGSVPAALIQSHKAALLSGKRSSSCRLWKRKGDGLFTPKDREHGYSYESRYPILGLYTWSEYQSGRLPQWALPYGDEAFSLNELPENVFGVRL
jgi:hypothetical protein